MKQRSFDRAFYFTNKAFRTFVRGFQLSAVKGRLSGPRVLMNSIPKSGTNMLERTLEHFPLLRNSIGRTLRGWDLADEATLRKLRNIRRGQFRSGHLPAHPEVLSLAASEGIKVLLMIRDPRDIALSYVRYVTSIDLTHTAHKHFSLLPDDDARLMAIIQGVPGVVSPLSEALLKFQGWLEKDRALVVRFEDLVGERGGGTSERQRETVAAIAGYLGIPLTPSQVRKICESIFSTRTLTFRKGKAGGWRDHFGRHHVEAFKKNAGDLLSRYGYEHDSEW